MIRGEVTNARAMERGDAASLHHWFNTPGILRSYGATTGPVSLGEVQRRVERWLDDEGRLGRPACLIIEALGGTPIGGVLTEQFDQSHSALEISIVIDPSDGSDIHAVDALNLVVELCFDHWNLHRLWIRAEDSNKWARSLAEAFGFQRDATLREAAFSDGGYEDVHVLSLLATDPRPAIDHSGE